MLTQDIHSLRSPLALLLVFTVVLLPFGPLLAVVDSDGDGIPDDQDNCPAVFNPDQAITISAPGDANGSGAVNSADLIYTLNYLFKSGPAPEPCAAVVDANCDGVITTADVVVEVIFLFQGGFKEPCKVCETYGLGWTCP